MNQMWLGDVILILAQATSLECVVTLTLLYLPAEITLDFTYLLLFLTVISIAYRNECGCFHRCRKIYK